MSEISASLSISNPFPLQIQSKWETTSFLRGFEFLEDKIMSWEEGPTLWYVVCKTTACSAGIP